MIKFEQPEKEYTLEEMMYHLKHPVNKRSIAELDDVLEEMLQRNPDFVDEINKIIALKK
jgi:hypothetical protein